MIKIKKENINKQLLFIRLVEQYGDTGQYAYPSVGYGTTNYNTGNYSYQNNPAYASQNFQQNYQNKQNNLNQNKQNKNIGNKKQGAIPDTEKEADKASRLWLKARNIESAIRGGDRTTRVAGYNTRADAQEALRDTQMKEENARRKSKGLEPEYKENTNFQYRVNS